MPSLLLIIISTTSLWGAVNAKEMREVKEFKCESGSTVLEKFSWLLNYVTSNFVFTLQHNSGFRTGPYDGLTNSRQLINPICLNQNNHTSASEESNKYPESSL